MLIISLLIQQKKRKIKVSEPNITISVTVSVDNGMASFSYVPEGQIKVTHASDVTFTLSEDCDPNLQFLMPLIAYVPANTARDITASLSADHLSITLMDTDADQEEIAIQLVVQDNYGNTYASPDPRIVNKPDN